LGDLNDVEKDAHIDVVAVLKDVGEIAEIVSKASQKTVRKSINLLSPRHSDSFFFSNIFGISPHMMQNRISDGEARHHVN
jgi:hypothetical protein